MAGSHGRRTWKLRSRPCQNQLRWMISNTALPGCRNCALARLEVCTDTWGTGQVWWWEGRCGSAVVMAPAGSIVLWPGVPGGVRAARLPHAAQPRGRHAACPHQHAGGGHGLQLRLEGRGCVELNNAHLLWEGGEGVAGNGWEVCTRDRGRAPHHCKLPADQPALGYRYRHHQAPSSPHHNTRIHAPQPCPPPQTPPAS